MKVLLIIVSIIALVLAAIAYYFYDTHNKLQGELEASRNTQDELMFKISSLEGEKDKIKRELEQKIADISKEKEQEIARVKGTYDELVANMKEEIEQGQIKVTQLADRLSVSMVEKILFPSGSAEVTSAGMGVLRRVGKILKTTKNKLIRVEGHTDNVPIHPRLQKQFPTNWELSTTRATNVVRILQEDVGIEGPRLQAVGMSEYRPVASNATPAGRNKNRRIEIALLPELGEKVPL
ncbi:MAG: OmpA family protein, partial [bacterium]